MSAIAVLYIAVSPPGLPREASKFAAKVENREVLLRTLEVYTPRDNIAQQLLVVAPDDLTLIQSRYAANLGFQGVGVTTGGPDWFGAVAKGLEKLEEQITTVIVHDVCRPAVPFSVVDALEQALGKVDAAAPYIPMPMVLARKVGGSLKEYVGGENLVEVQSPQIFKRAALVAAHAQRSQYPKAGDDFDLVRLTGGKVALVEGSHYNRRIDHDDTVRLGADLLRHMPKPKPKGPLSPFNEAQW